MMGGHATIHAVDDTNTRIGGGVKWIPVKATPDGAVHIAIKESDVTTPAEWYVNNTFPGVADATVLYSSGDVTAFNRFTLTTAAATPGTDTVTISVSLDGVLFTNVDPVDMSDGAHFGSTTINADGTYYVDGRFRGIRVTQAGAGVGAYYFSHSNV